MSSVIKNVMVVGGGLMGMWHLYCDRLGAFFAAHPSFETLLKYIFMSYVSENIWKSFMLWGTIRPKNSYQDGFNLMPKVNSSDSFWNHAGFHTKGGENVDCNYIPLHWHWNHCSLKMNLRSQFFLTMQFQNESDESTFCPHTWVPFSF